MLTWDLGVEREGEDFQKIYRNGVQKFEFMLYFSFCYCVFFVSSGYNFL